jgi:hypothetical protein
MLIKTSNFLNIFLIMLVLGSFSTLSKTYYINAQDDEDLLQIVSNIKIY